ncbi:MAG TPA: amidohydrolase family protein [Blastocatellia bacterium]|nr:amidohydrolase family protein [Blastocatellia bacterium]
MRVDFPGFFDLQVNGFAGVDFNSPGCTPEQLKHTTDALRSTGVTRFLPTLITSSIERFSLCARSILRFSDPAIAGIHMEGPYISPVDGPRGAHSRKHVIGASIEDFSRRQDAAEGRISLVTLAPEVPGALRLIEHLVKSDIRVAIGHSAALPEQIRDAVSAGATLSTHLGNGCAQVLRRHPNFIWQQLAEDELYASFIVDGHHLPPATVKSMMRAKQPSRTILVTDATAAAGCPPGFYTIGDARVELDAVGRVAVPGAPNLAGSALAIHDAIANTVRFTGLSLSEVLPMASTLPARYLGAEPVGHIVAEWDEGKCTLVIDRVIADVP